MISIEAAWPYLAILLAALLAAGAILYRRWQSRRALEQRVADLSTLADIGRAITDAPLDLSRLADVIYEQASQIVDTSIFQLGLFHGDHYRLLIWIVDGSRQPTAEFRLTPDTLGIVGWMRESRRSLLVRDFDAERDSLPARPRYISPDPPRSAVFVPLQGADSVLGAIAIQSRRPAAFSEEHLRLLSIVANHAAAALEKARVYEQAQRRADQLATIAQVSRAIVSTLELEELLDEVLDRVEENFGYKRAHIFLLQDERRLVFRAGIGKGAARWSVEGLAHDLSGPGLVARAGRAQKAVFAPDVSADPDYVVGAGLEDTRIEMAAPMAMGGKLLGVFDVQSEKPNAFTDDDLPTLQTLADTLAVAVRNARLFEIERRRRLLAETLRDVSAALTSTLDLDHVLDLILDGLARVVVYDVASILLTNDVGELTLRATRGLPEMQEAVGEVLNVRLFPKGESFPAVITFGEVDTVGEYHDLLSLPEPHACLGAVLALHEEHIGYLVADRAGELHFPRGEVELIAAFASQAAIAIANARLYNSQMEQAWVSTALLQVAEATTQATEVNEVVQAVARLTPMLAGVDRCAVLLTEGDEFVINAYYNDKGALPAAESPCRFAPADWPQLQRVIETCEPLVISAPDLDDSIPADLRRLFSDVVILLPLLAKGHVQGLLAVGQEAGESPFNTQRVRLLSGIANQTAVAVESLMLYQSQQEEAWVSAALLQVAEAVAQQTTLEEGLEAVARLTPMLVGIDRVAIYQWDESARVFHASQIAGLNKSQSHFLKQMPLQADEIGVDPADPAQQPILKFIMPDSLADIFCCREAMVWPLRARGDLLGALVVEHVPLNVLGRRLSILDGIAHHLSLAMENARLAREVVLQQRLERDVEVARDIQASFLPEACPVVAGWEVCSYWQAARQVGGDFYDFIPLRPREDGGERWGLVVADVADKGVPAALFMALSRTLMRTVAINRVAPATTLARLNELIFADAQTDLFVTFFYAVWEPDTGRLHYANAGHNPPVWVGPNREPGVLAGRGVPVGVFEEAAYQEHEIHLQPGDALLLYTDGLPDAVNSESEEFGLERVKAVMRARLSGTATDILNSIVSAVQAHVGVTEAFDDMTMVAVKRKAKSEE